MHPDTRPPPAPADQLDEPGRYSAPAVAVHWLSAALIIVLLALGYYMVDVPRQVPLRGSLFNLHKSLGVIALALVCGRLAWRLKRPPPPLPDDLRGWQSRAARASHLALYALMFAQPLTGYSASALSPFGITLFGLALPSLGSGHAALREALIVAHHFVAAMLVALIVLHLAGVAKSIADGRIRMLRRMTL